MKTTERSSFYKIIDQIVKDLPDFKTKNLWRIAKDLSSAKQFLIVHRLGSILKSLQIATVFGNV